MSWEELFSQNLYIQYSSTSNVVSPRKEDDVKLYLRSQVNVTEFNFAFKDNCLFKAKKWRLKKKIKIRNLTSQTFPILAIPSLPLVLFYPGNISLLFCLKVELILHKTKTDLIYTTQLPFVILPYSVSPG